MPFRYFLHFCSWFPSFILRIGSVHSEFREFPTVTASSIQDVSLLLTVLLTRAQAASELGSSHVGTSRPSIFLSFQLKGIETNPYSAAGGHGFHCLARAWG